MLENVGLRLLQEGEYRSFLLLGEAPIPHTGVGKFSPLLRPWVGLAFEPRVINDEDDAFSNAQIAFIFEFPDCLTSSSLVDTNQLAEFFDA